MRGNPGDLALFGGAPAFATPRTVGRPSVGDRAAFLRRVEAVLDAEWFTNFGPQNAEFEAAVAGVAGVDHCVAAGNATVALEMVVGNAAEGWRLGDEVIVPSLTYPATAQAVSWRGLRPVFADADPVSGLIDPEHVESLITDRTRAILGVHLFGQVCDVERLEKIADGNGLRLYFDAAHAIGCTHDGKPIGGFGDAEVFSFHATKIVNCLEGGAITTNDPDIADRMRAARSFGFGPDHMVGGTGTNGKLNEVEAAMGLTSLAALATTIEHNRRLYECYVRALHGIPGVTTFSYDHRDTNNHHYMMCTVDAAVTGLHRDLLLDVLRAENVLAQPYFSMGVHQMPAYRDDAASLPRTEALCEQLLALPTGVTVDESDVDTIAEVIRFAVAHGPDVTARRGAQ